MADALGARGPTKAAAETMQNRLKPRIPAARTVKGPLYSLALTFLLLNKNKSEVSCLLSIAPYNTLLIGQI